MGHLPTAEQERHLRLCPTYQHSAEAVTAGSEAERAAIVEWLRSDGLNTYDAYDPRRPTAEELAVRIERGEHLERTARSSSRS